MIQRTISILAFSLATHLMAANQFVIHNLVADTPGAADHTDPCLINSWGIVSSPTSPFWVSANGTGLSTLYDGNGLLFLSLWASPDPPGPPRAALVEKQTSAQARQRESFSITPLRSLLGPLRPVSSFPPKTESSRVGTAGPVKPLSFWRIDRAEEPCTRAWPLPHDQRARFSMQRTSARALSTSSMGT